ncbi:hypothetical protein HIM_05696 [Hirsutella minnesotensis 3608]|uniref:Uncharacterized protein n=1 Tax=Hirsutella minnesotensis 3608 TaxID=1043627 RepID=A0A0F7ZP66_9HYPO|nr:hypothetical protein HIM_05696 [Hirsutella minnesotensis 3608]
MWPRRQLETSLTYEALKRYWEPVSDLFTDPYPANWHLRGSECEEVVESVMDDIELEAKIDGYARMSNEDEFRQYLQVKYEVRKGDAVSIPQRFEVAIFAKALQFLDHERGRDKYHNARLRLRREYCDQAYGQVIDLSLNWKSLKECMRPKPSTRPSAGTKSGHAREADTTEQPPAKRQKLVDESNEGASQPTATPDDTTPVVATQASSTEKPTASSPVPLKDTTQAAEDIIQKPIIQNEVTQAANAVVEKPVARNEANQASKAVVKTPGPKNKATQAAMAVIEKPNRQRVTMQAAINTIESSAPQSPAQEAKEFIENLVTTSLPKPGLFKDWMATNSQLKDEVAENMERQLSSFREQILSALKELQTQPGDMMQQQYQEMQGFLKAMERRITHHDTNTTVTLEELNESVSEGNKGLIEANERSIKANEASTELIGSMIKANEGSIRASEASSELVGNMIKASEALNGLVRDMIKANQGSIKASETSSALVGGMIEYVKGLLCQVFGSQG